MNLLGDLGRSVYLCRYLGLKQYTEVTGVSVGACKTLKSNFAAETSGGKRYASNLVLCLNSRCRTRDRGKKCKVGSSYCRLFFWDSRDGKVKLKEENVMSFA